MIAYSKEAAVRFDGATADDEPQTQALTFDADALR